MPSKHTPGPWEISRDFKVPARGMEAIPIGWSIVGPNGELIATGIRRRGDAEAIAAIRKAEGEAAVAHCIEDLADSLCSCKEGEFCVQCEPRLRTTEGERE
jgi:hypothetical protein